MYKNSTVSRIRPLAVMRIYLITCIALLGFPGAASAQGVSYNQVAFEGDELDDGGAFSTASFLYWISNSWRWTPDQ
jgi:hypothetical protein